jgi:large subunit ribosomal protein L13e
MILFKHLYYLLPSRKLDKWSRSTKPSQVDESMSFDIIAEPVVRSPKDAKPRRGRGFSIEETVQSGLTVEDARKMGLFVDIRRKTAYPENVEALKQYQKDLEEFIQALAKEEGAATAVVAKAVDELSALKAVNDEEAKLLASAGIKTVSDLAYCDIPKTANKTGIPEDRITAMVKAALKKV